MRETALAVVVEEEEPRERDRHEHDERDDRDEHVRTVRYPLRSRGTRRARSRDRRSRGCSRLRRTTKDREAWTGTARDLFGKTVR